MFSPKHERSTSPIVRDMLYHGHPAEQPQGPRVRDFEERRRRQFEEQHRLADERLAERRQFSEQHPIAYQHEVVQRYKSVEDKVAQYVSRHWPEDKAREHVLEKFELWERLEYKGYAAHLQKQHQERVNQISSTVRRMNQIIPGTWNETGLSRFIDQSVAARNEVFHKMAYNVTKGQFFPGTSVDIVGILQEKHRRGDKTVQHFYRQWNLVTSLERSLSELKYGYTDEDTAVIYDKVESLIEKTGDKTDTWHNLQKTWEDLTAQG